MADQTLMKEALQSGFDDEAAADFLAMAAELEALIDRTEVPSGTVERAHFVQGVAAGPPRSALFLHALPSALVAGVFILVGVLSHSALPGQVLFPVRKAMSSVGLAPSPLEEANERIQWGEREVARAEHALLTDPEEADALAMRAITDLGIARRLLTDVKVAEARSPLARIGALEDRAKDVIVAVRSRAASTHGKAGKQQHPIVGGANDGSVQPLETTVGPVEGIRAEKQDDDGDGPDDATGERDGDRTPRGDGSRDDADGRDEDRDTDGVPEGAKRAEGKDDQDGVDEDDGERSGDKEDAADSDDPPSDEDDSDHEESDNPDAEDPLAEEIEEHLPGG